MKTTNSTTHQKTAAEKAAQLFNLIIAVSGAVFCIYGIYLQVVNNL
jgi:hypothetical protein